MRGTGGLVAPAPPVRAPSATQLTYRGGPLLTAVEVVTVFWGAAWNEAGAQATAQSLNDFFQFVVASPYVDQLGEYSTAQQKIGRGRYTGTARVSDSAPGASVTDSAVQEMLQREVARKSRSEEHTSELQSLRHLVCRLLLEKKKQRQLE